MKESKLEKGHEGVSFGYTFQAAEICGVSRKEKFTDVQELFTAAGKSSWHGEEIRKHLSDVGIDLAKERRRLEDALRKDPAELCRVLAAWYKLP